MPLVALLIIAAAGVGCAQPAAAAQPSKYTVRVAARLRPLPLNRDETAAAPAPGGDARTGRAAVLPLHQRLQLIQAREACSHSESRRWLWQSRGGQRDAWAAAEAKVPDSRRADGEMADDAGGGGWQPTEADGIVRPCVLSADAGEGGHVLMCCPSGAGIRRFGMDHVLTESASQEDAYRAAAGDTVKEFLGGRSACIFAYGQTGSGKSHTIFGATDESACAVASCASAACTEAGVVPRACSEVLAEARSICARGGVARVSLSMVELFGEVITNLLAPKDEAEVPTPLAAPRLQARRTRQKPIMASAVLRGMHALPVNSPENCAALLAQGMNLRSGAHRGSRISNMY